MRISELSQKLQSTLKLFELFIMSYIIEASVGLINLLRSGFSGLPGVRMFYLWAKFRML